jgi:hypothetical protein
MLASLLELLVKHYIEIIQDEKCHACIFFLCSIHLMLVQLTGLYECVT